MFFVYSPRAMSSHLQITPLLLRLAMSLHLLGYYFTHLYTFCVIFFAILIIKESPMHCIEPVQFYRDQKIFHRSATSDKYHVCLYILMKGSRGYFMSRVPNFGLQLITPRSTHIIPTPITIMFILCGR